MAAPRFDLYRLIHKAQRAKLFELTTGFGRLNPDDTAKRDALATDARGFFVAMREHAEAEDQFFGPLYDETGADIAARLRNEHEHVEQLLDKAEAAIEAAQAMPSAPRDLDVYDALCRFTALYFGHVDSEEGEGQRVLWASFDDNRLATAQAQLVASHTPSTVAYNLRMMLPAVTSPERVGFLHGLRQRMPPPVWTVVRGQVAPMLPSDELGAIDGDAQIAAPAGRP